MGRLIVIVLALTAARVIHSPWVARALAQEEPAAGSSVTTTSSAPVEPAFLTRAARECGLNSLYMLLRLQRHPVSYDDVKKAADMGPRGSSMLQLREAAARLHVPARVSHCSLEDLLRCPKPVIAHFKKSFDLRKITGHYVVVLAADENGVAFLDGTSARISNYRLAQFQSAWSGYILSPVPPFPWDGWAAVATLGLWLGLGLWWWRGRKTNAETTRCRPNHVPVGIGV